MRGLWPALSRLAFALVFGAAVATFASARAIFRIASSKREAGRFSGAGLLASERLQWGGAAVALLGTFFTRELSGLAALLFGLQAAYALVNFRLRALRDQLGGSTEGLEAGDPRRKQFGALHGVSVLLLAAIALSAAAAIARA